MRFISVRDFRSKSASVWKNLKTEHEMIVTSNGKPVALMTPVSEESLDSTLSAVRTAKAIAAVHAMQLRSLEKGNERMTLGEINEEIRACRKERDKHHARSH
jgi:antitoxin (DNA-binding transcriptional repressor) of toxin-antitoxin stability system